MKYKFLITLATLILIIVISITTTDIIQAAEGFADMDNLPIIVIDAGHGGFDGGAVAEDGTVEKDINLSIALKLEKLLSLSGYSCVMTRTTDTGTDYSESYEIKDRKIADMKNRLKLINNNDNCIFVSIHLNKFDSASAKGAQVFYGPKSEGSKELGLFIQKRICEMLQPDNKRSIKQGTKGTYLLYYAERPAVIVECGFLSNFEELTNLKDDVYQEKIAFSILCGILDYYS